MIVEGMLFVGNAEGKPLAAAKIASHIRDVSADEVDQIVGELNAAYRQDETAYEIVGDCRRLPPPASQRPRHPPRPVPRPAASRQADARGDRGAQSVVAYRQGVSGEELNKLRGSQSHAILAQLVRRHLVRVERAGKGPLARYHTTSRFNQLFGVSSPADLPRSEDLDDS